MKPNATEKKGRNSSKTFFDEQSARPSVRPSVRPSAHSIAAHHLIERRSAATTHGGGRVSAYGTRCIKTSAPSKPTSAFLDPRCDVSRY